jgi:hypothetical protein
VSFEAVIFAEATPRRVSSVFAIPLFAFFTLHFHAFLYRVISGCSHFWLPADNTPFSERIYLYSQPKSDFDIAHFHLGCAATYCISDV